MSGFGKLMKQAQKMQGDMMRVQEELKSKTAEGMSAGGAIKVVVSCDKKMQSIQIDKSLVTDSDIEMLQDLVVTAVNQALENADQVSAREMSRLTNGVNIPGLNLGL